MYANISSHCEHYIFQNHHKYLYNILKARIYTMLYRSVFLLLVIAMVMTSTNFSWSSIESYQCWTSNQEPLLLLQGTQGFASQHPHWAAQNNLQLQLQGIQCHLLTSPGPGSHTHTHDLKKRNFKMYNPFIRFISNIIVFLIITTLASQDWVWWPTPLFSTPRRQCSQISVCSRAA